MSTKGFNFSAKRSDQERECKYKECHYYNQKAKRFCCGDCAIKAHTAEPLEKKEAGNE